MQIKVEEKESGREWDIQLSEIEMAQVFKALMIAQAKQLEMPYEMVAIPLVFHPQAIVEKEKEKPTLSKPLGWNLALSLAIEMDRLGVFLNQNDVSSWLDLLAKQVQ